MTGFRIRQISQTADGRDIVRSRDVADASLLIGRSAECAVHLPDLAVEPEQARVTRTSDGALRIDAVGTLGFAVDGRVTTSARIEPARGAELAFGGHRITVSADPDGIPVLAIRRTEAISESAAEMDAARNFSLSSAMPAKRLVAWGLFAAVMALFLAVPIYSNLMRAPDSKTQVAMEQSWTPGPLSAAHHALEKNCTACHAKPFESVRSETCQSCHKEAHDHAAATRLDRARAAPGFGVAMLNNVAHQFGKEGPGACVDCHREHEGAGPMQPVKQVFCADCHKGLKDNLADTALGNAADFGTAHPEFRALVAKSSDEPLKTARVSLASHPVDANGLAFSHAEHLDKRGTVARMALSLGRSGGYGAPLDCANCHRETADGVRFVPVEMERDCGACHSLAYDELGGTTRRLRHGDFAQMVADLRAANGAGRPNYPAGSGLSARKRPGAQLYRASFGGMPGNSALTRAISTNGICGECHSINRTGDVARWSVEPVHQTARYFLNGWFDHKAHKQEECTDCHQAPKSTKASDLMLPGIGQCRNCHLGESATKADVPSSCVMCHDYHPDKGAPWAMTQADTRKLLLPAKPRDNSGGINGAMP